MWGVGLKDKLQNAFAEYGRVAVFVYITFFASTIFGFWALLTMGVDIRTWSFFSGLGDLGALGLAYAATKLTQPVRIVMTLAFTPVVARFVPAKKDIQDTEQDASV